MDDPEFQSSVEFILQKYKVRSSSSKPTSSWKVGPPSAAFTIHPLLGRNSVGSRPRQSRVTIVLNFPESSAKYDAGKTHNKHHHKMMTNLQSVSLIASEVPSHQREEINAHHVWNWRLGRRRLKEAAKKRQKKSKVSLKSFICQRNGVELAEGEMLHELWRQYAEDFLQNHKINEEDASLRSDLKDILPKMELIGAKIEVTKAKCSSIVGTRGIIIMDSKNMFTLVNMDGRVIHLPKVDLAFQLSIGSMSFLYFGKFLTMRIADRCVKAYKNVQSHEL
ncbi:ribonuclease P protein subunit p29 [Phlebotomus argentipes]|uniref:ribonuclease P protein subunit p29 n=1 Tax=Phlebotomus argentipes TaxID=94469 RepID=UPI0028932C97|nr:ribonuclease P protein subunit p29 [Phlebotomus argentipes]